MQGEGRLEEFIAESLVSIIKGITTARSLVDGSGAKIGWSTTDFFAVPGGKQRPSEHHGVTESVSFDLAVTSRTEVTTDAGGKLQVWVLSVGGDQSGNVVAEEVSRLRFSIPLTFPPPAPGRES